MPNLVTVAQLREHVKTSLVDAALQRFLDAADQAVVARLGPLGNVTDVRFLRGERIILLGRVPGAVGSITELYDDNATSVVLAAGDYVLDGSTFRRLDTGPNPPDYWAHRTTFVYTPGDDTARRVIAIIRLCALDITENDSAGVVSRTVGQHKVDYGSQQARREEREAIWSELEAAGTPLFA